VIAAKAVGPVKRGIRMVVATLAVVAILFVVTAGVALADHFGPARGLVDAIERQIGPNDPLHYDVHLAMGKVLSLCPCTAGLSRDQYRRAAFHRPRPSEPPPIR
jgi:hypothetical protein